MAARLKPKQNGFPPLPQDGGAEMSVLGAVIRDERHYHKVRGLVNAEDFFAPEHRIIFQAFSQLAAWSKPIEEMTLIAWLSDSGSLEKAGGVAYVTSLADGVHDKFNSAIPARCVHELSLLRQIAAQASLTASAALLPGAESRGVLNTAIAGFREMASRSSSAWSLNSLGSGAKILEETKRFVRRFVALSTEQSTVVALWAAHTHAFTVAIATPYLHINSAEKQSGKTRLLEVLELLCANPWLTGRTSPAALSRKIDSEFPTLLLDEADAAFGSDQEYAETLRGILNTGHRLGGKTSLCVGQGKDISVRDFSTFCPKAIAGLGKLPDTVADRSVPIMLKRAASGEIPERFRRHTVETEAGELRDRLAQWAGSIFEILEDATPILPDSLSDRQQDGAEPLLAIADAAGGNWAFNARAALTSIFGGIQHAESHGTHLLADIRSIFEERNTHRISSGDLTEALAAIETSPWAEWSNGKPLSKGRLARLLKPFDIAPHSVRLGKDSVPRGYDWDDFEDAWARYLSPSPQNATMPQTCTDAALDGVSKRHSESLSCFEKEHIPSFQERCGSVALLSETKGPGKTAQNIGQVES